MSNANRPKSSIVGIGDFALSAVNYRKMASIERQSNDTISALEQIRDIQTHSMLGIISLHNELKELSSSQWKIIDHLKDMENRALILGNLKLILIHIEEQCHVIERWTEEYPEFAAMLSMNLNNLLREADLSLDNLKMMSVPDLKWAKSVLENVANQYTILHSNSNTINLGIVLNLEKSLAEISGLNENLIQFQSILLAEDKNIAELQGQIEQFEQQKDQYLIELAKHELEIEKLQLEIESVYDLQDNLMIGEVRFSEKDKLSTHFQRVDQNEVFFKIILPIILFIAYFVISIPLGLDFASPLSSLGLGFVGVFMALSYFFSFDIALELTRYTEIDSEIREAEELNDEYDVNKDRIRKEKEELIIEFNKGWITANEMRIIDENLNSSMLKKENLTEKIEIMGGRLSDIWKEIEYLVPNNSSEVVQTPAEEVLRQVEAEKLVTFVSRWEELPEGKWLNNDENGVNWYLDKHDRHWYSDQGGFRIWDK